MKSGPFWIMILGLLAGPTLAQDPGGQTNSGTLGTRTNLRRAVENAELFKGITISASKKGDPFRIEVTLSGGEVRLDAWLKLIHQFTDGALFIDPNRSRRMIAVTPGAHVFTTQESAVSFLERTLVRAGYMIRNVGRIRFVEKIPSFDHPSAESTEQSDSPWFATTVNGSLTGTLAVRAILESRPFDDLAEGEQVGEAEQVRWDRLYPLVVRRQELLKKIANDAATDEEIHALWAIEDPTEPPPEPLGDSREQMEIQFDEIDGTSVADFCQLAKMLLEGSVDVDLQASRKTIACLGKSRVAREDFRSFAERVLWIHGLRLWPVDDGFRVSEERLGPPAGALAHAPLIDRDQLSSCRWRYTPIRVRFSSETLPLGTLRDAIESLRKDVTWQVEDWHAEEWQAEEWQAEEWQAEDQQEDDKQGDRAVTILTDADSAWQLDLALRHIEKLTGEG